MAEIITLDVLIDNSISLARQIDGEIWRKSYINSEKGRAEVESEVAEPHKTTIFTVWGDTPTVSVD